MARTIRDTALDSRAARSRLRPRGKPYYRTIEEGLHLGYRKSKGRPGRPAVAGKWVLRCYVGNQSYVVETIGAADDLSDADGVAIMSFAQAQAKAREHMVRRAHHAAGYRRPVTVRDVVEAYLHYLDHHKRSGRDARYRAEAQIYPTLGDIEVDSLQPETLRRWQADLVKGAPRLRTKPGDMQRFRHVPNTDEGKRRRKATTNRVLGLLKAALNRAWRDGRIKSDDAWRRVEPYKQAVAARVRWLTVAEAQRLVNACEPDFRALVQAGLTTGARYGELVALRVGDFDPDSATLTIRLAKNGRGRHVVLTEEGARLFAALAAGKPHNALLLPKADGSQWLKTQQTYHMSRACERAGIDPPIGFHGLRHTWASLAVMNRTPLMVVAKALGHADTRMVEKHYGHLAPDFVNEAIRAGAPRFGLDPSNIVPITTARR